MPQVPVEKGGREFVQWYRDWQEADTPTFDHPAGGFLGIDIHGWFRRLLDLTNVRPHVRIGDCPRRCWVALVSRGSAAECA